MIVLTDCLTVKVDEGALKVANSLTKRLKKQYPNTTIISYGDRTPEFSDVHLKLNKLFLNLSLMKFIKNKNEAVFYIPFSSNTKASIIRTFILSIFCKKQVKVLYVLKRSMSRFTGKILKMSKAKIFVLSKESFDYFQSFSIKDVCYIKTGVDVEKFKPVSKATKMKLRKKYQIDINERIILHVGHLHNGRNVDKLLYFSELATPYLVVSSVSRQDDVLRNRLKTNGVKIFDTYISNIEEIYQISDIYLFPVEQPENCIDVPLSVLEAAACNLPIITTCYGELKNFINEEGFKFIDSFNKNDLIKLFYDTLNMNEVNNRQVVAKYDWSFAINQIVF